MSLVNISKWIFSNERLKPKNEINNLHVYTLKSFTSMSWPSWRTAWCHRGRWALPCSWWPWCRSLCSGCRQCCCVWRVGAREQWRRLCRGMETPRIWSEKSVAPRLIFCIALKIFWLQKVLALQTSLTIVDIGHTARDRGRSESSVQTRQIWLVNTWNVANVRHHFWKRKSASI